MDRRRERLARHPGPGGARRASAQQRERLPADVAAATRLAAEEGDLPGLEREPRLELERPAARARGRARAEHRAEDERLLVAARKRRCALEDRVEDGVEGT